MEIPHISNDDLQDVYEMTLKMERCISATMKENDENLAMSALMSATINSIFAQCKTLDDVLKFRNIFFSIFDSNIRNIRLKDR